MFLQSIKKYPLASTSLLSNYENDFLVFNFRFLLTPKKLESNHYKKILDNIINKYSIMKVRQFIKTSFKEMNDTIIAKQYKKNHQFTKYLKQSYQAELKILYNIYKDKNGMSVYGVLKKNVFYLLEIELKNER